MSSVKLSLLSLTVGNNFDRLLRGYQTLRPRLTKYCRGCVPGIPGVVDAYGPPSGQIYAHTLIILCSFGGTLDLQNSPCLAHRPLHILYTGV